MKTDSQVVPIFILLLCPINNVREPNDVYRTPVICVCNSRTFDSGKAAYKL